MRTSGAAAAHVGTDEYIRPVAGNGESAEEIERAEGLLDSGAITPAGFDQMKRKAVAA